ncbi:MAG: hypothetical protein ABIJ31_10140 [Pseudomonadota bacterium]
MTILKQDRIIRFRDRLYQKKIPRLFKIGSDELAPIKKSKTDQQGNTVIATKDIISFFHTQVKTDKFIDADQYFNNLYLLFKVLTKDSDQYTFESDIQISVEDIQAATDKKAIEYLTTNLIISFFDNAHLSDGSDNDAFLEKDLNKVIIKSREGRDYRTLVGNTLQAMVKTLQLNKPWRESLGDIQTAAIVCRLVGAKLPQIDKAVLSNIVAQARSEIKQYTSVFTKILNTKEQLIKEEKNQKNYLMTMKKLDAATIGTLKKINIFLGYAHTFIASIGASIQGFLGPNDTDLKLCIARFFFEYHDTIPSETTEVQPLGYSITRYRLGILFEYPDLIRFTLTLKQEKIYAHLFDRIYGLYYQEIIKQMALISRSERLDTTILESCIGVALRVINKFGLTEKQMESEKKEIKKRFLSLIRLTHHEHLPGIIDLKERISQVIQDHSKELLEDTRRVLIENCYSNLIAIETKDVPADELNKTVQTLILGYSIYYKPQRFFYQKFFYTFIGEVDGSLAESFSNIIRTKKILAIAILTLFSDVNHVGDLLAKNQIEYSGRLLLTLYEKK